jgi:hypothetical protein
MGCKIKLLKQLYLFVQAMEVPRISFFKPYYKNGRLIGFILQVKCGKAAKLKLVKKS